MNRPSPHTLHRTAPGKINLGLHVLRKRPDGFHDIETVFVRIPWADVLYVSPADDLRLTCSDPELPVDESNLVFRAAQELLGGASKAPDLPRLPRHGRPPRGAYLHLEKHLPVGAGLGGGSSDAAAALSMLNEFWGMGCSHSALARMAARLGSDVPFFLGHEVAIGTGRGEQLEPLIDPDTDESYRLPFALVVAVPGVQVSTARAYATITPRATGRPDLRELVLSNELDRWRAELVNDFEGPVFGAYPAIRLVKEALLDAGAGYAAMSGSGSAVYGFFESDDEASGAAEALFESGHRVWHGRA